MYNEKKNKLTETIRERLKNYERPAADEVWISIQKDLAAIKRRRIRRQIIAPAAAAIIALAICIPLLLRDDRTKIPNIAEEHQNITADLPKIITEIPQISTNNIDTAAVHPSPATEDETKDRKQNRRILTTASDKAEDVRNLAKNQKPVKSGNIKNNEDAAAKQDSSATEINSLIASTEIEDTQPTDLGGEQDDSTGEKMKSKDDSKQKDTQTIDLQNTQTDYSDKTEGKSKKKTKRFDFALAMGNSPVSSGRESKSDIVMMNEVADSHLEKIFASSHNFASDHTDTRFGPPISAGLLIRKHLSERWALESGLVYTGLYSLETSGNVERKINLHYAGIPLGAVYTFLELNRFSVYATAGGMGEICFWGKERYNIDLPSKEPEISGIQWSVFGGFGMDYKIAGPLRIFIEPNAVYYFDDGNNIKTIRKSVPLNVNFRAGLRLRY